MSLLDSGERQRLINPVQDEDTLGPLPYLGGERGEYTESILTNVTTATSMTDQAPLFDVVDEVDEDGQGEENTSGPAHAERISSFQAFVNLFKGNLGTGILAMPYAFSTSGLWLGILLISFFGVVSIYCMHQLRYSAQYLRERFDLDRGKMDYGETAKAAFRFGPQPLRRHYRKAKILVNAFIVIVQFGFCCVYVLFMAQNIQSFLKLVTKEKVDFGIYAYAAIVLAFILPYCVVKKLRKLTILSYIANALTVLGLILILVYCWQNLKDYRKFPFANGLESLPISIGIMMYSFEAISLVLPIENKMTHPEDYAGCLGVLNISMVILVLLYIMVGYFGYLGLGEAIGSSITYNIPVFPWYFALVKPMFVMSIFVSYGIQFYVPAYVLLRPIDKRVPNRTRRKWVYRSIKAAMICITFCVAIAIPHLELLISLIGALFSSALALVFPPLIEIIAFWPTREDRPGFYWLVFKNVCIVLFGFGCIFYGTALTLKQIVVVFSKDVRPTPSPPANATIFL